MDAVSSGGDSMFWSSFRSLRGSSAAFGRFGRYDMVGDGQQIVFFGHASGTARSGRDRCMTPLDGLNLDVEYGSENLKLLNKHIE